MNRKPAANALRPRLRRLPLAMAAALAGGLAQAAPPPDTLPTGGSVVSGSVNITPLTSLDLLVQQTTAGGIINWNTFSIGQDASVTFQHSSANAVTLNRVITTVPSEIFGTLSANGRVFIINPNGVVFGGSAQVNVGGLVASTLGISNADFNAGLVSGQFRFGDVGQDFYNDVTVEAGASLAAAPGGTIALMGGIVENGGSLVADGGTVALASAREVTLDFFGDGLTQVSLSALASDDGGVVNLAGGTIQSDGGRIFLRASTYDGTPDSASGFVDNQGVLRARSTATRTGQVEMTSANGEVSSGPDSAIDATGGTGLRGGSILLRGNEVRVGVNGTNSLVEIDASGGAGGGDITLDATTDLLLTGETDSGPNGLFLRADALVSGDGGTLLLRSGQDAKVEGELSARGAGAGAGGLVHTMAVGGRLDARGTRVDAGGAVSGQWHMESGGDFVISAGSGFTTAPILFGAGGAWDSDISAALDTGTRVRIGAGTPVPSAPSGGSLYLLFGSNIQRSSGSVPLELRLDANRMISGNGFQVGSTAGALDVLLNSDASGNNPDFGEISLSFSSIRTNGGALRMFGQGDPLGGAATGEFFGISLYEVDLDTRVGQSDAGSGGDVSLRGRVATSSFSGSAAVNVDMSSIQASTGSISIHGQALGARGVTLLDSSFSGGSLVRTTTGDIRIVGLADTVPDGSNDIPGIQMVRSAIESAGGDIDLRGRSSGDAQNTTGVQLSESSVSSGGGRLWISGTSGGASSGIVLDEESSVDGGAGHVVLRAAGAGIDGAFSNAGSVSSASLVNLRAGEVDADGAIDDSVGQVLLLGGAEGFASIASLQGIDAPLLVVGHAGQVGAIELREAWTRSGNLTLQNASADGIAIDGTLDVGGSTLVLASAGDITQGAAIRAGSLLATSSGGAIGLQHPDNIVDGNTIAGSTAGDFVYSQVGTVTIGSVSGTLLDVTGAPTTITVDGITAGGDVRVQSTGGDIVQLRAVTAGGDVDLVSAGVYLNSGAALSAGGRWKVWADTWVGEDRGGLVGGGPLPNLYNCSFEGSCGVVVDPAANQFIYAQQPRVTITIGDATREYGLVNPAFTFSLVGLILGDAFGTAVEGSAFASADAASNVGSYLIDGSFTSAAGYGIDIETGLLSITPATLTLVADPFLRFFGQANPAFTGTVTGFRNDDTLSSATTGTLQWTSQADAGSLPGTYAINGSGLDAGNYVFVQAESNQTALRVMPLAAVGPDLVRENPTTYLYDRNISPMLACPIAAPTDPLRADQGSDGLAREWTRVRSRPNLTSCIASERKNGCSDF